MGQFAKVLVAAAAAGTMTAIGIIDDGLSVKDGLNILLTVLAMIGVYYAPYRPANDDTK